MLRQRCWTAVSRWRSRSPRRAWTYMIVCTPLRAARTTAKKTTDDGVRLVVGDERRRERQRRDAGEVEQVPRQERDVDGAERRDRTGGDRSSSGPAGRTRSRTPGRNPQMSPNAWNIRGGRVRVAVQRRQFDRQHQQRERDGEHGIGEEREPTELGFLAPGPAGVRRAARRRSCRPGRHHATRSFASSLASIVVARNVAGTPSALLSRGPPPAPNRSCGPRSASRAPARRRPGGRRADRRRARAPFVVLPPSAAST